MENNKFILYSLLTTSEKNDGNNLLESLDYYKNGLKFVDILEEFDSNKIKYSIQSGFHGSSLFNKNNKFKKIIITVEKNKDKINKILDKFKDCVKYDLKGNDLIISII